VKGVKIISFRKSSFLLFYFFLKEKRKKKRRKETLDFYFLMDIEIYNELKKPVNMRKEGVKIGNCKQEKEGPY
jgi:hypothetical protein